MAETAKLSAAERVGTGVAVGSGSSAHRQPHKPRASDRRMVFFHCNLLRQITYCSRAHSRTLRLCGGRSAQRQCSGHGVDCADGKTGEDSIPFHGILRDVRRIID